MPHPEPAPSTGPIALAHRGGHDGTHHPPENTRAAFAGAAALGVHHLETDVHATRDGVVFAFHDDELDALTDGHGAIADLTADEVRQVRVAGREPVPELAELLETFPDLCFNIDVKHDAAVRPTVDVVRAAAATERVCFASFSHRRLTRLRRLLPDARTSASPLEVAFLRLGPSRRQRARAARAGATCVQVSRRWGPLPIVGPRFVRHAHQLGLDVHVWTVNDPAEMTVLLDLGVDGIVTDRPDLLVPLLDERSGGRR